MKPFTLGLAAGCINSGFGLVPINHLYHRVLSARMRESGQAELRVRLANIAEINPAHSLVAVRELLERQKLDGLVFNVRSEFLWAISTLVWSTRAEQGEGTKPQLNRLKYRQGGWEIHGTPRPIGKLRRLNWSLGRLVGAEARGWRCLSDTLTAVAQLCREHDTRLALTGPIVGSWFLPNFIQQTETRLSELSSSMKLRFIPLSKALPTDMPEAWSPDGFHLLAPGHRIVADQIQPLVESWLKE